MANRFSSVCAYIDEADATLQGNNVHIVARSGRNTLEACMSRDAARKMAKKVIRMLDAASIMEQDRLVPIKAACRDCEAFRA